ncbi:MAG: phosphotransferase [Acidimicrobiales bacterium]
MTDPLVFLAGHGIDRPWLGRRLVEAGVASAGAEVASLSAELIGTGQVGENVRCHLDWTGGSGPSSVVVKLPSTSARSRAAATATRTYVREVGFYRDVRDRVTIPTPVPFHVSEDRGTNAFVLVMNDLTPTVAGDQLAGCSVEQAELAMVAIAGLHGPTWGCDELVELDWVDTTTEETRADRVALVDQLFDGFVATYGDRLTAHELDLGRALRAALPALIEAATGPRCLVHGDYRLDNVLFGTGPGVAPLTTVDWQTVSYGHGLADVAYFLSGALPPTERRSAEERLLGRYRHALAAEGVDLTDEVIRHGYRLGSASGYLMAVIASQIVGRTDRGDAMFVAMARGSAALVDDVDLLSLLDR